MSCNRYYILLDKLSQTGAAEQARGLKAGSTAAYQEALARVRVHAEDCEECIAGVKRAFPELNGKTYRVISLIV